MGRTASPSPRSPTARTTCTPTPTERDRIHRHLRACIDAAELLSVPYVTTFIGRDITLSLDDNLKLAEQHLPPLAQYAADHGVKLLAENCPMEGWHPDGCPGNLGYSPNNGTGWLASASASPTIPPIYPGSASTRSWRSTTR